MNPRLDKIIPSRVVLAVTIGGVIRLGILHGPGEIAKIIPEPTLYLLFWLDNGISHIWSITSAKFQQLDEVLYSTD